MKRRAASHTTVQPSIASRVSVLRPLRYCSRAPITADWEPRAPLGRGGVSTHHKRVAVAISCGQPPMCMGRVGLRGTFPQHTVVACKQFPDFPVFLDQIRVATFLALAFSIKYSLPSSQQPAASQPASTLIPPNRNPAFRNSPSAVHTRCSGHGQ